MSNNMKIKKEHNKKHKRKTSLIKMTWRSIKTSLGRYMALLLIVALSAGFFAGLKITKDAMVNTGDKYLAEQNLYDFRLLSTYGFNEEDVKAFAGLDGIEAAEGMMSLDAIIEFDGSNKVFKIMSIPDKVNVPALTAGRMPEASNECLADDAKYTEDDIGTVIKLSWENDGETTGQLETTEYTIVGIVDSPIYMGVERGTTSIGSGALSGYIYVPMDSFAGDVYTEINISLNETAYLYSDEYNELIERYEDDVVSLLEERAEIRYNEILKAYGMTADVAEQAGIAKPMVYTLTRNENAGYVSFENDTAIVSGIANIFPIFFIMIAMLVCMTTMTRMVDEERTQIGVLKAMGFSNANIVGKYLLYAGSATVIGWTVGYFVCTWGLPEIFWFAYNALYDFAPLSYLFSPYLAAVTLLVSLAGILGSAYLSCRKELFSVPAKLIRPRATKKGKRIFLERLTFLWKSLSFLQKITLRNMFRYKRKLILMLVGISCCAGLVVTAFGVGDSMSDVAGVQYEDIQKYDFEASFESGSAENDAVEGGISEKVIKENISEGLDSLNEVENYIFCSSEYVDILGEEIFGSVNMLCFDDIKNLKEFWNFHEGDKAISYPGKGEAIINTKMAEKLSLSVGDIIEIQNSDMKIGEVRVSGIFDNYIRSFVVIAPETYEEIFGEWRENTALISVSDGNEVDEIAKTINEISEITSIQQLATTRETVDSALSCLDYIILMVVVFSGALAFIVIYNLTNINLAERSREVATVQVLGFYPKETESYVLRENIVLSVLAGFVGLPLGVLFHRVVMSMIQIDLIQFKVDIQPLSFVYALVCTVLFAVIVNVFMKRQIGKIHMAESLKAVE